MGIDKTIIESTADSAGLRSAGPSSAASVLHLQVVGDVRLWADGVENALPRLRKASAVMTILAMTDGHATTRRELARLLWSRSSLQQGLSRVRDTLHQMKAAFASRWPGQDVLKLSNDRVELLMRNIKVDLASHPPGSFFAAGGPGMIAADLDGLDPALDAWLEANRLRLWRQWAERNNESNARAGGVVACDQSDTGVTIVGVCPIVGIGLGGNADLLTAIAEEITGALSRLRWLLVLSTASMADAANRGGRFRKDLGADFVLRGTLHRRETGFRISMTLVDTEREIVVSACQRDYGFQDLTSLQDDTAALVAAAIDYEMPSIQGPRIRRAALGQRGAHGLVLQACLELQSLSYGKFMDAGSLLRKAIILDPDYAPAHAWLAFWRTLSVGQGWSRQPAIDSAGARAAAERAVEIDPANARCLAIAGHTQAYFSRRIDEAISFHDQALAINPTLPIAWQLSGVANAYAGNLPEARTCLEHFGRFGWPAAHGLFQDPALIVVELLSENYAAAAEIGRRALQFHPNFTASFKPYLAALGHLGRVREARVVYERLLKIEPNFNLPAFKAQLPFIQQRHVKTYLTGLKMAEIG